MFTRRFLEFLAAFALMGLLAAACGSGDDTDTAGDDAVDDQTDDTDDGGDDQTDDTDDGGDDQTDDTGDDADDTDDAADDPGADGVRQVPGEYATIQAAVDAAAEGDLVLIGEGVYNEAVIVQTDNLVIRGIDRNTVILDGEASDTLENGFLIVGNGVAVENLTVRNYVRNGIFFTGDYANDFFVDGWRASYVTVHNVGDYGVYAFNAVNGQIDNSFGAAAADSPFYVGQCKPCNALVYNVEGTTSQLGYSGTNSSGTTIAASWFHDNMIGIVNNSSDGEELAPHTGSLIVGNLVENNNNRMVPRKGDTYTIGVGSGIVMAGTDGNIVERNTLVGNERAGVIVVDWIAEVLGGSTDFPAIGNVIRDNRIQGSLLDADLLLAKLDPAAGGQGNCYSGNTFGASIPADTQSVLPCDGADTAVLPPLTDLLVQFNIDDFEAADFMALPAPAYDFDNMPGDPATDPAEPAVGLPMEIDLDALVAPEPSA